jgi:Clp amino terminal domain, pathogenicity island component/SnoaL-like domain
MFERCTEKARRVIFFACYEASQYGSPYIETEHLLLGLLREDSWLVRRFLGPDSVVANIRTEIEELIPPRERISTSVEVPLTEECKRLLNFAAEESERLAQRHIDTGHLLLGILRVEGSLASRLLRDRGVKPEAVREQLARHPGLPASVSVVSRPSTTAIATLDSFLTGLKWHNWEQLAPFFAQNAQFIDSTGRCWKGREEIEKQFEALFAPYAKKNITFLVENTDVGPAKSLVAGILWENVTIGTDPTRSIHRMTVILAPEGEDWAMFFVQITPVLGR